MDLQRTHYSKWIRYYVKHHWYLLAGLAILALISIAFSLLSPVPMKFLADYVFGTEQAPNYIVNIPKERLLLVVIGVYFLLSVLENVFDALEDIVRVRFNQIIDRRVMLEAFSKTNSISTSNPLRKDNGTYLYQITQQSQQLSGYILENIIAIFKSIVLIISVLSILTAIDIRMTILCFTSIPLLTVIVIYFGRVIEKRANETEIAHSAVYEFIEETLEKLRTVQIFAKERFTDNMLTQIIHVRNKKANRLTITNNAFGFSSEFVILSIIGIALIIGGNSVLDGKLTFGDLLLFITYMSSVFDPLTNVVSVFGAARQQRAALSMVDSSINAAESIVNKTIPSITSQIIHGDIQLKNVSYRINGNDLYTDVNLHIEPGTLNALVGPSGQGKSTLFNMLLGFLQPTSGKIYIDGVDLHDYPVELLRENISLIDQEPDIFNVTIRENIAYAKPDVKNNLPDVMTAAIVTNSSEFIEKTPDGYDTIVGNQRLSGGQKQRLALARAYYKHAPIVLMDEPTSALDKKSSEIFIKSIEQHYVGKTVILITHDLNLLASIPNIFVVEQQQILPIAEYGGLERYKQSIIEGNK